MVVHLPGEVVGVGPGGAVRNNPLPALLPPHRPTHRRPVRTPDRHRRSQARRATGSPSTPCASSSGTTTDTDHTRASRTPDRCPLRPRSAIYTLATAPSPVLLGQLVQARRDLARRLVEIEEAREHERQLHSQVVLARERAQLAREMHDVVSHQVSLIAVQPALCKSPRRKRRSRKAPAPSARSASTPSTNCATWSPCCAPPADAPPNSPRSPPSPTSAGSSRPVASTPIPQPWSGCSVASRLWGTCRIGAAHRHRCNRVDHCRHTVGQHRDSRCLEEPAPESSALLNLSGRSPWMVADRDQRHRHPDSGYHRDTGRRGKTSPGCTRARARPCRRHPAHPRLERDSGHQRHRSIPMDPPGCSQLEHPPYGESCG